MFARVLLTVAVIGFIACWLGAARSWLRAMGERREGGDPLLLWFHLTPNGKRLRNRGFVFWLGGILFWGFAVAVLSLAR
jgi:hypothetical protein